MDKSSTLVLVENQKTMKSIVNSFNQSVRISFRAKAMKFVLPAAIPQRIVSLF